MHKTSLSRLWDRLPFAGRLLFTASMALVIAGLVMVYTSARRDAEDAAQDLRLQLQSELSILPSSLAELLVIGDFSTLQQTLDHDVRRGNLSRIRFHDTSGAVLESREEQGSSLAPDWFVKWLGLADQTGEAPTVVGGRDYGTLAVTVTARREINRAWARLVRHLSILLLAIVLDFIGIWLVLRAGLKPLRALDAGSSALGKGDFAVRIPLQGSPELRRSFAAFNQMAASLQQLMAEVRVGQESLRESEERFREALEHAPIGMAIMSPQGGFIQVNRALCDMLGYTRDELRALALEDVTHSDDKDTAAMQRLECGASEHYEIEKRFLRKDKRIVQTQVTASLLRDAEGKPRQIIMQVQDISERKRLEEELRTLNRNLNLRVEREVAQNRDKDHILIQQSRLAAMGEMVHNIAHQWRQPLNALSVILTNIKDDFEYQQITQAALERDVSKARALLQGMSTTIDDFRDFFRPDHEPGEFDLGKAVENALFVIAASLASNNIAVVKDLPPGIRATGFSNQFAQVVLNILANAKEAIHQHQVVGGSIHIVLARVGDEAVLTVADNGGGIPEAVLPKIFDPYFTTKDSGSGIGLYMSKMIVERNFKGKIGASNSGAGALVSITLPLTTEGKPT